MTQLTKQMTVSALLTLLVMSILDGGGGGYVGENGQTPYVYTIGSYFPDRPVFFFP
jgi:hypothetical protein